MRKRYLLTNRSKSQFYNVVHILGEAVVSKTLHKCNAIVYFTYELPAAREALAKANVVPFELELTQELIPELLDMEL